MSTKGLSVSIKKILGRATTVSLLTIFLLSLNSTVAATNISQGYQTNDSALSVGMAASLSTNNNDSNVLVERSSNDNNNRFVGIVTTIKASTITVTDKAATVVVARSGEASVYVSNVDGDIRKGDNLTTSPLLGILVKANQSNNNSVAVALEDFNTTSARQISVNDQNGKKITTYIGNIKTDIKANGTTNITTNSKSILGILGQSITGRAISNFQAVTILVIFLLLLVVEGSLIYGAIHGTIISLGRNPLAQDAIFKQLLQVIITAVVVLLFGGAIIFTMIQI